MTTTRPRRQRKTDRLLNPGASQTERRGDMLLAPFDRRSSQMDEKWGVQRLPELVSVETARKWGATMANLSLAQDALFLAPDADQAIADLQACVESALRGFDYMDAEAERLGAPKADTTVWEYELDGTRIGILKDADAWPAVKKVRPDLVLYSVHQCAVALLRAENNPVLHAVVKEFPTAQITRRPQAKVDDTIPF